MQHKLETNNYFCVLICFVWILKSSIHKNVQKVEVKRPKVYTNSKCIFQFLKQ